jgi:hypothetical protein
MRGVIKGLGYQQDSTRQSGGRRMLLDRATLESRQGGATSILRGATRGHTRGQHAGPLASWHEVVYVLLAGQAARTRHLA